MMTKEEYEKEIVRMWDMKRGDEDKGKDICDGVFCEDCPLSEINNDGRDGCMEPMKVFEIIKIVEKWSKEHPQKKYKISQLEYDILKTYSDDYFYYFYESELLKLLLKKGYFKGANEKMNITYYLRNCEVVD